MKRALLTSTLALLLTTGTVNAERPGFGSVPSTGDPVRDCGEWVRHADNLPDEAIDVVEKCLDLHGWTYDED